MLWPILSNWGQPARNSWSQLQKAIPRPRPTSIRFLCGIADSPRNSGLFCFVPVYGCETGAKCINFFSSILDMSNLLVINSITPLPSLTPIPLMLWVLEMNTYLHCKIDVHFGYACCFGNLPQIPVCLWCWEHEGKNKMRISSLHCEVWTELLGQRVEAPCETFSWVSRVFTQPRVTEFRVHSGRKGECSPLLWISNDCSIDVTESTVFPSLTSDGSSLIEPFLPNKEKGYNSFHQE